MVRLRNQLASCVSVKTGHWSVAATVILRELSVDRLERSLVMLGMVCCYSGFSLRLATLLLLLIAALVVAMHSHMTADRTLDETEISLTTESIIEGDHRLRLSDIEGEGGVAVELIADLTNSFLEEVKALGEERDKQFLGQLDNFRWLGTP